MAVAAKKISKHIITNRFLLPGFVAILIVVGASAPAWATHPDASIDPDAESSPFYARYQKTIGIWYPEDGLIHDQISGQDWQVVGSADSSNPGVQDLTDQINRNLLDSESQASVSDLEVFYKIRLKSVGNYTLIDPKISYSKLFYFTPTEFTSIHYTAVLKGSISDYLVTIDSQRELVDRGWRGLGAHDEVVIDGVEINTSIGILESHLPETYELLAETADNRVLRPNINADFIREHSIADWHFHLERVTPQPDWQGNLGYILLLTNHYWSRGELESTEIASSNIVMQNYTTVALDQKYIIGSAWIGVPGVDTPYILDGAEIAKAAPTIQDWVRIGTSYWVNGDVPDSTFVNGMQYIMENGIVHVPSAPSPPPQPDSTSAIPDWIRANLSHWANGDVPDSVFVSCMQFLINNGTIHIRS